MSSSWLWLQMSCNRSLVLACGFYALTAVLLVLSYEEHRLLGRVLLSHNHQPLKLSHSLSALLASSRRKTELKSWSTLSTLLMNKNPKWLYTVGPFSLQACRWGPLSVPAVEVEFFFLVLENKLLKKMSLQERTSWNGLIFPLNEYSGHSAFTLTTPFAFSS